MSIAVKGGLAFLGDKFEKKDILIEDGKISQVGTDLRGLETIDASGMLVLPGLIDPHVHLREPGATQKEDFRSGGRAAIAGGFTTVMDMPNNPLPTVTVERLKEKRRLAKKALCEVLFHFGGTDDNFDEVKKADPPSMKIYLGLTTGELMLRRPESLERHFREFPHDRPIVLHCGSHKEGEEENMRETIAITEHAVSLAKRAGRRIHLAHASSKKELTIAKSYGKCTVEVTPHHLFLNAAFAKGIGPYGKVYPPLRTEKKRLMLLSAMELADCIATDHAPHTSEEKEEGAAGFPGLETSLALMLDACNKGLIDRIWVAQRMSHMVAEAFNLEGKGRLKKGYIGDVTIVDLKKEWKADPQRMESKCRWTPYEGKKLKGKVHTVVKAGVPVYQEYEFV